MAPIPSDPAPNCAAKTTSNATPAAYSLVLRHKIVFNIRRGQPFEMQHDYLSLSDRQLLDGGQEPVALLLLDRVTFLRRRGSRLALRIAGLLTFAAAATGGKRNGRVVRDPVDPRSLRAVAAKPRQRRPQREGNVLKQILTRSRIVFVRPGEAPQRTNVALQQVLIDRATVRFAHV